MLSFPHLFTLSSDLRDDFRTEPKDSDATPGEEVELRCSPPRGHPAPEVTWVKDGEVMQISGGNKRCVRPVNKTVNQGAACFFLESY